MTGPHEHFGVYGAWLHDGRLVTVRKARGPYTGWLDLPGGAPEAGESEADTLRREVEEECGVRVLAATAWTTFDVHVERASDGSAIDFRHRGRIALVDVDGPAKPIAHVEDVVQVVVLDRASSEAVTPSVRLAWDLLDAAAGAVRFRIPDDIVADGDLPEPAPGVDLHGVGLRMWKRTSGPEARASLSGTVVWARVEGAWVETVIRAPRFDVLTHDVLGPDGVPSVGRDGTVDGALDAVRPHEYEDFHLPDVRASWSVRSVVSRTSDGYVVDAVPIAPPRALDLP